MAVETVLPLFSTNSNLLRFRRQLLRWYRHAHRKLPWRETRDPYRIWVSEIMLQQTRVAAVLSYYERFLARFPDVAALAAAPEADLLAAWSGLGYYSRARNLQRAAQAIVALGDFPRTFEQWRALPGIGDYTAAAIASLCYGVPKVVVDGNVLRVTARLSNDEGDIRAAATRKRLGDLAQQLLDTRQPANFNQALMELGATVCTPRDPKCSTCPVREFCAARLAGTQAQLPVKLRPARQQSVAQTLLIIQRNGSLLLRRRDGASGQLAGFYELPMAGEVRARGKPRVLGVIRHGITNTTYSLTIALAQVTRTPAGFEWIPTEHCPSLPLATTARKALKLAADAAKACAP
jgi:A/G-specific adenine glycosylase